MCYDLFLKEKNISVLLLMCGVLAAADEACTVDDTESERASKRFKV